MQYLSILPTLVTVFILFYMGFVVVRNEKSALNRAFLAFISVDAAWLFSVWIVTSTPLGSAILTSRIVFAISLLLGIFIHVFTNTFLNIKHGPLYKLFMYGLGSVMVVLTLVSGLVI